MMTNQGEGIHANGRINDLSDGICGTYFAVV
jgi:hypothetical protein